PAAKRRAWPITCGRGTGSPSWAETCSMRARTFRTLRFPRNDRDVAVGLEFGQMDFIHLGDARFAHRLVEIRATDQFALEHVAEHVPVAHQHHGFALDKLAHRRDTRREEGD